MDIRFLWVVTLVTVSTLPIAVGTQYNVFGLRSTNTTAVVQQTTIGPERLDTIVFDADFAEYTVFIAGNEITVTAPNGDTDTLIGVDVLQFDDRTVVLSDVVYFRGPQADYTIAIDDEEITVADTVDDRDGTDTLMGVTLLQFEDGLMVLDE
ncbi:MAG: hypothetical protein AAF125_23905 [Chloroflexota bacterium]